MVVGSSSAKRDTMKFEIGLPFQTRGIERGRISTARFFGLENVKNVLVSKSRCSLWQLICRIGDKRKSIKDASDGRR